MNSADFFKGRLVGGKWNCSQPRVTFVQDICVEEKPSIRLGTSKKNVVGHLKVFLPRSEEFPDVLSWKKYMYKSDCDGFYTCM